MKRSSNLRSWLGGFLCGLVVFAALVLVTRTFFVQGLVARVETVSGSMAPWLFGPRVDATCDECGIAFALDALDLPSRERLDCPNCGVRAGVVTSTTAVAGEQVLIDRRVFASREPQRWEPVVFQCQQQTNAICIKRVVGLPGEGIMIRSGDIYIDGEIARKSLAQQRDVAIVVHDSRWRAKDTITARSGWQVNEIATGWNLEPGHFQYSARSNESPTTASDSIRYQHIHRGRSSPVLDDYGYNQNVSRVLNPVTDLVLEFELSARGKGQITLTADAHGHRFSIEIKRGQAPFSDVAIYRDGELVDEARLATSLDDRVKFEFSLIDQQVLLAIDGDVILKSIIENPTQTDTTTSFSIRVHGMDADFYDVRIWRDIYYTRPRTALWGFDKPCRLGEGEYFVLGDNSPISSDSRVWPAPGLASKYFVGKPLRTRP